LPKAVNAVSATSASLAQQLACSSHTA
jgi:hypothetical protein